MIASRPSTKRTHALWPPLIKEIRVNSKREILPTYKVVAPGLRNDQFSGQNRTLYKPRSVECVAHEPR